MVAVTSFEWAPGMPQRLVRSGGQIDVWARGKAEAIAGRARELAPSRSGTLRASIKAQQAHDLAGRFTTGYEVAADAPYARYVHDGTPPHQIRPVNARFLRFEIGGAVVFARVVNHPGTRPNQFLTAAAQQVVSGGS